MFKTKFKIMAYKIQTPELKPFGKTFDFLSRKYGAHDIFDQFLDLFINGFCFDYKINLEAIQNKYSKEERLMFGELIQQCIIAYDKNISKTSMSFDFFGTFFEERGLTNARAGQFFTPIHICKFMAEILSPQSGELFSDPCCGSGRFSICANAVNLGMFHFLVDIDYRCAKMAALNLMLHGINGIVICDNGLFPGNSFCGAFIVNRNLNIERIPRIEFIDNVNVAYNYVRTKCGIKKSTKNIEEDYQDIKQFVNNKTGQISMF